MPSAIFSLPRYETASEWSYPYLKETVDYFRAKGFIVYDENPEHAVKDILYNDLRVAEAPKVFLGCGHGNETTFTGQNDNVIFESCNYPKDVIKDVGIFLYSCLTAHDLGKDFIAKGARAYIGWLYYAYVGEPNTEYDSIQKVIRDAWKKLADGWSFGSVYNWMVSQYLSLADKYKETIPDLACIHAIMGKLSTCYGEKAYSVVRVPSVMLAIVIAMMLLLLLIVLVI